MPEMSNREYQELVESFWDSIRRTQDTFARIRYSNPLIGGKSPEWVNDMERIENAMRAAVQKHYKG